MSTWPYGLDPTVPQYVKDESDCVYGTCPYIPPEALLSAGWTVGLLEYMDVKTGEVKGFLSSSEEALIETRPRESKPKGLRLLAQKLKGLLRRS
jgi:hypothetical protein